MALLRQAALPTVLAIKMYAESMARFGGDSPYIYPLYGLGELPQAFARLSAVYGGTYMLNKPGCEVIFDEAGRACGVRSEGETARAPIVVGDPSYFPGKCRLTTRVIRAMCIMNHPIPNTNDGKPRRAVWLLCASGVLTALACSLQSAAHSAQIIIPNKQIPGRTSDVYVFCCSYSHCVVGKNKWVAFVSTRVETAHPLAELAPGLALLGPVEHTFTQLSDVYAPLASGAQDGCYISKGYDETSHFEGLTADVLDLYRRVTGKELDLKADPTAAAAGRD